MIKMRHTERENVMSKKQLKFLMLVLTILALGSILLAACSRTGVVSNGPGSTPTTGSGGGEPTVHMAASNFVQSTVTVPKGSKLMLVDDGQYIHILLNGSWINGAPHTTKEPGAPTVNSVQVNGTNVEIGPFTTAGSFHIYCSVHPGMNLTITVQ